jgi:hypothetical protein
MWTAFEVVAAWVVLNCTLGPVVTWLFFYGERRARTQRAYRAIDESPARQGDKAGLTVGVRAASLGKEVQPYSRTRHPRMQLTLR